MRLHSPPHTLTSRSSELGVSVARRFWISVAPSRRQPLSALPGMTVTGTIDLVAASYLS
jgi:hypothetical protein